LSFDDDAAGWAEYWAPLGAPAREAVADALELGAGKRVLDAGCGSGEFLRLARERGAYVEGIDSSPAMAALARARVGSLDVLPFPAASFDFVTGFNSLQFAPDPVMALREWRRVAPVLAVVAWGELSELDVIENALRRLAGLDPLGARFILRLPELAREAGLTITRRWNVSVPFEADRERLLAAALWDARSYELEETHASEVILRAAEPFRRANGSYRLENTFVATLLR